MSFVLSSPLMTVAALLSKERLAMYTLASYSPGAMLSTLNIPELLVNMLMLKSRLRLLSLTSAFWMLFSLALNTSSPFSSQKTVPVREPLLITGSRSTR